MRFIQLSVFLSVSFLFFPQFSSAQTYSDSEIKNWSERAKRVKITRDKYGVPHVMGESDADAVFGLIYAQCEDDFRRVELNYIEKLGRMSEIKGESHLAQDLLMKILLDSAEAEKDYRKAPQWLRDLLDAHAAGINYFLYKNPALKPLLLTRFKAWYHLLWTDGSIGAINTAGVSERELAELYLGAGNYSLNETKTEEVTSGSNGFAVAPSKSASGFAMLYINPHVSFYFRPEVHMQSKDGLNAYGAVTWGQLFIYQGFNEYCGWMHTSGYSDNADLYIEKIKEGKKPVYVYEKKRLKLGIRKIELRFLKDGKLLSRNVTTYYTHHGPVIARRKAEWLSLKAMNRDMNGLIQCWERTRSKGFQDFKKSMRYYSNPTNNTVFAAKDSNIAYFHGNFHPKRNNTIDWSKPVDGTLKSNEWTGVHSLEEGINIYNPKGGWLQSCNSSPFTAAGREGPSADKFPAYMGPDGDNFRSQSAIHLFETSGKLDLDALIKIGYNRNASAFNVIVPHLVWHFNRSRGIKDSAYLSGPIALLNNYNYECTETSVATTLTVELAEKILPLIRQADTRNWPQDNFINRTHSFCKSIEGTLLVDSLRAVLKELERKFGTWAVPWGEINRMQRAGDDDKDFNDSLPSLPLAYVSSTWGMLPSLGSQYFPGTRKRYAVNGNSFVCAVEFAEKIRAKSLLAGGQSADPKSPHYFDQAQLYRTGTFKEVRFYKEDIEANTERSYHPGE